MAAYASYLWLVLLVVGLAALVLYLGFLSRPPRPSEPGHLFFSYLRGRNKGAFLFVMVVLLPLVVFGAWRASRIVPDIAELIAPYPNVREVTWVARVDETRSFLIETDDPAGAVLAFHADPVNRPGWTLVHRDALTLRLERDDETLLIVAGTAHIGTRVLYRLGTN